MKHSEKRRQTVNTIQSILKFLILLAIVIGLPLFLYFRHPEFWAQLKSLEDFNAILDSYSMAGIFIYLGAQIVQVVVGFLPGQVVQMAGGYAFHFWVGYGLSIGGCAVGTAIAFLLAKGLGTDIMYLLFGKERIDHYVQLLNSKKALIVLCLLYLIPGFPKDLITYAAGISRIPIPVFLIISLAGRTPAMMGSVMIGSMTRNNDYTGVVILGIAAVLLFIYGALRRKALIAWAGRLYDKWYPEQK